MTMAVDAELQRTVERAARLLDGRSFACAESCTAGLLAQAFAAVDGSGDWFRGGVVAYQRGVKVSLLDVDPDAPLVSRTVAEQMASGLARRMGADVTVATTGAAGPEPLDGAPPGTVVVALFANDSVTTVEFHYPDADPEEVVERAAIDAIVALAQRLSDDAEAVRT